MAPLEFHRFPWIDPWRPISVAGQEAYEEELRAEMSSQHPLFGLRFTAIARAGEEDDVLFLIHGIPSRLTVVHLTFTGAREPNPRWPSVQFFNDVEDWVVRGMMPDAARYERTRRPKAA